VIFGLTCSPNTLLHTSTCKTDNDDHVESIKVNMQLVTILERNLINNCSTTFVRWKIDLDSRFLLWPGFLMLVLIQQISSQRRKPHFFKHCTRTNIPSQFAALPLRHNQVITITYCWGHKIVSESTSEFH
jgi:hypothetical protein